MKAEGLPFPQDEAENELPISEAVDLLLQAEIQALKQAEMVSAQLYQILERQTAAVKHLKMQIKQRRNISPVLKIAFNEIDIWRSTSGEIWQLQQILEKERIFLESIQVKFIDDLAAFEQLQEEINNL